MQTIVNYFALLLTGVMLHAQNTVEVSMTNFGSDDGKVMVGLYDSQGIWLETEYKTTNSVINNKTAKVTFSDVPDGIYAVSCFHDENDDSIFDMFFGFLPKEDYGCSNGATGMFGPPKWEDAKFELKENETKLIHISL